MQGGPKISIHHDAQSLAQVVAKELFDLIKSNPKCVLGLATGSTPIPMYKELVRLIKEDSSVSLAHVHTFNLDEYLGLPEGHVESYARFMDDHLFSHVNIPRSNVHFPRKGEDYDAVIKAHGGVDVQILGIGVNGHIGFNEPGSSFDSTTRVVDLTPSTRTANARFFGGKMDLVPTQAVTMGIATIMSARKVIVMATGSSKADVLGIALSPPYPSNTDIPASALHGHSNTVWHVDNLAAAKIAEK